MIMRGLVVVFAVVMAVVVAGLTPVSAQESPRISMVYGVMGGVVLPQLSEKSGDVEVSNGAGFQAGAMWGVKLRSVEFVPELWYTYSRCNISGVEHKGRLATSSVELPVLIAVPLGSIFRVNVGPTFTLMCDSKLSNSTGNDIDFGRLRSTAGWVVGASATLWGNIIIDTRFCGYFKTHTNVWSENAASAMEYTFSHQTISMSIGYRF